MLKINNKNTKQLRVALIVLFIIIILANSFPFVQGIQEDGLLNYYTATDLLLNITAMSDNAGEQSALAAIGWSATLFYIIPVVGLGFAIFDRERNLKNVAGVISSIAGVMAIIYIVGPSYLSIGSMLALLLYIATFLVSVFGMLARYLVNNEQ